MDRLASLAVEGLVVNHAAAADKRVYHTCMMPSRNLIAASMIVEPCGLGVGPRVGLDGPRCLVEAPSNQPDLNLLIRHRVLTNQWRHVPRIEPRR